MDQQQTTETANAPVEESRVAEPVVQVEAPSDAPAPVGGPEATPAPLAAPRLEACYFSQSKPDRYARFARVLRATAHAHCPDWKITVEALPTDVSPKDTSYARNVAKLAHWAAVVAAASDGDRVACVDADTMILRSLDDVWLRPFDLAYTVRIDGVRYPFNSGVVFLRVSAATRAFMQRWLEENLRMLRDHAYHERWRKQFGGINQAAFGALLTSDHGLQLQPLPCLEWNCEDSSWESFDPRTRIVHIKGALRAEIIGASDAPASSAVARLADIWRQEEVRL